MRVTKIVRVPSANAFADRIRSQSLHAQSRRSWPHRRTVVIEIASRTPAAQKAGVVPRICPTVHTSTPVKVAPVESERGMRCHDLHGRIE